MVSETAPEPVIDPEARIGEKVTSHLRPPDPTPEPEPAPQADAEPPAEESQAEPAAEPVIPDKFQGKTPEEIVEMYRNLESEYNRRDSEIRELRERQPEPVVEEPAYEEPATFTGMPTNEDLATFDAIIDESPAEAANLARQLQNPYLYKRALEAFYDEDEVAAMRYEMRAELDAREARLRESLNPVLQQHQIQEQNQQHHAVWEQLRSTDAPDIDQYAHAMRDTLRENPAIFQALQASNPEGQKQIFRLIYHAARSRTGTHAVTPGPSSGTPTPAPPHVASGETGRFDPPKREKLDIVQAAIRQANASEPSFEAGLTP